MQTSDTSPSTSAVPSNADVIAAIWADVLGCETCSRDVNYFDLGGTSLKMMRIHAEAQRRLGMEVSIVEMFAYPTINSFAQRLLQIVAAGTRPQIVFPAPATSRPLARAFRPMKPRS